MASKGGAFIIVVLNELIAVFITFVFGYVLFPSISKFELATG